MPTPTFTFIASSTVGAGGASSIDFTSIPGTYTDLVLYLSGRSTGTNANAQGFCYLSFNGSTTNFSSYRLYQDGTSVGSDSGGRFAAYIPNNAATSNTFGTMVLYIGNYTSSNNKPYSIDQGMENNSTSNYLQGLSGGVWSNSSAITSIGIGNVLNSDSSSANFIQYSTAYLYGIVKS
jgi:hypothetical protein